MTNSTKFLELRRDLRSLDVRARARSIHRKIVSQHGDYESQGFDKTYHECVYMSSESMVDFFAHTSGYGVRSPSILGGDLSSFFV